jgi:hypothetical protein
MNLGMTEGRIASGVSRDEIQAEMTMLADTPDSEFAAIVQQAYEDALAGRPPKFSSPFNSEPD